MPRVRRPDAPAPCVGRVPADVDVAGFVAAIARRRPRRGRARRSSRENLLGGTCARVCPVEELCEGACVLAHEGRRADRDRPRSSATHATRALERGPAPRATAPYNWSPRRRDRRRAGGARLRRRARRARLRTSRSSTSAHEPGGLVRYAIAPYRQLREPLPRRGALARASSASSSSSGSASTRADSARRRSTEDVDAVVLGVGMGADAESPYPGDDLPGVWGSLPFIEAIKTGAPPDVGRRVVVIGGGNTAIDVAREALGSAPTR